MKEISTTQPRNMVDRNHRRLCGVNKIGFSLNSKPMFAQVVQLVQLAQLVHFDEFFSNYRKTLCY